jgi:cytochrome bd-type quinol oxidase subunit 2
VDDALLFLAIAVAVLNVPTLATLLAWGLTGGDGEERNPVVGISGMLVFVGAVYAVGAAWLALDGVARWQWWLMWLAPVAGTVGVLGSGAELDTEHPRRGVVLGLGLVLVLAAPALLVLLGGGVSGG